MNGLIAIFQDEVYAVTDDRIVVFDFTQWGWIHLIGGILVAIAGLFVAMVGATWARVLGIMVAFFHALGQIAFIEAYPFWTLTTIALDIIVIFGLLIYAADEEVAAA